MHVTCYIPHLLTLDVSPAAVLLPLQVMLALWYVCTAAAAAAAVAAGSIDDDDDDALAGAALVCLCRSSYDCSEQYAGSWWQGRLLSCVCNC